MTYTNFTTSQGQAQIFSETALFEASLTFTGVYLIHADSKLAHAQHYIGYSNNIAARIALHRKSQGSKLVKAFNEHGIGWKVARVWKGETRDFERRLHNGKQSAKWLCPVCRQQIIAERLKLTTMFNTPLATTDMFVDASVLDSVVAK